MARDLLDLDFQDDPCDQKKNKSEGTHHQEEVGGKGRRGEKGGGGKGRGGKGRGRRRGKKSSAMNDIHTASHIEIAEDLQEQACVSLEVLAIRHSLSNKIRWAAILPSILVEVAWAVAGREYGPQHYIALISFPAVSIFILLLYHSMLFWYDFEWTSIRKNVRARLQGRRRHKKEEEGGGSNWDHVFAFVAGWMFTFCMGFDFQRPVENR